jgi:hypothetical protein
MIQIKDINRSGETAETLGRIRQLTGATVDYLYFGEQAGLPLGLHQRILEIGG